MDNGRRRGRAAGGAWPPARLPGMDARADLVDRVAADTELSGVVRVDRYGEVRLAEAYGLADRGWGVANTVDTGSRSPAAPGA